MSKRRRIAASILIVATAAAPLGRASAQPPEGWVERFSPDRWIERLGCSGGDLVITGDAKAPVVSGACRQLSIRGDGNNVTVEAAAEIALDGDRNHVTWLREGDDGRPPIVVSSGAANVVVRAQSLPPEPFHATAGVEAEELDGAGNILLEIHGAQRDFVCGGRNVAVSANGLSATLRGNCGVLRIRGHKNRIVANDVGPIVVIGDDNLVSWRNQTPPAVYDGGARNMIGVMRP